MHLETLFIVQLYHSVHILTGHWQFQFRTNINTVHNFHCLRSIPASRHVTGAMMPIHTTNNPTGVPIYTPGWRAAMWIKCIAEGQKVPGIDGNRTRNPLIQSQGSNPICHGTSKHNNRSTCKRCQERKDVEEEHEGKRNVLSGDSGGGRRKLKVKEKRRGGVKEENENDKSTRIRVPRMNKKRRGVGTGVAKGAQGVTPPPPVDRREKKKGEKGKVGDWSVPLHITYP